MTLQPIRDNASPSNDSVSTANSRPTSPTIAIHPTVPRQRTAPSTETDNPSRGRLETHAERQVTADRAVVTGASLFEGAIGLALGFVYIFVGIMFFYLFGG